MDVHVRRAITDGLRRAGVDVLTVRDLQLIAEVYEPTDIAERIEYLPL